MTGPFTIEDMSRLLREAAGAVDGVDWADASTLDTPFEDLGYDSLGLIEFTALVKREYRITIDDDAVAVATTPRAALDYVTRQMS